MTLTLDADPRLLGANLPRRAPASVDGHHADDLMRNEGPRLSVTSIGADQRILRSSVSHSVLGIVRRPPADESGDEHHIAQDDRPPVFEGRETLRFHQIIAACLSRGPDPEAQQGGTPCWTRSNALETSKPMCSSPSGDAQLFLRDQWLPGSAGPGHFRPNGEHEGEDRGGPRGEVMEQM